MPRITTCMLDGQVIGIEDALARRATDPWTNFDFRCPGCREPVRAHTEGPNGLPAAHFEHHDAVPDCPVWQSGGAV